MKASSIYLFFTLTGFCLLSVSCNNRKSPEQTDHTPQTPDQVSMSDNINSGKITIADQIVYDVEIINPNPEDEWTSECLSSLDHQALIDFVFEGLYSGEFIAFDIFEGSSISTKQIRKMEEDGKFTREQIGKFQFKEVWILDTLNMSYSKTVSEIRMGLQRIQGDGTVANYDPLLRVIL